MADLTGYGSTGGQIPFPGLQQDEQADLPNAKTDVEDFVNQVRLYLRDYPELNRLIAGVENSNRQIVWAVMDTLDEFNTTPPFTRFGVGDFPSRHLLLRGTVISLLESVGLLQTRNHLAFNDGGIQVGINDKTPFIQSWLNLFKQSYEDKKIKLKVAYNIESGWGGGVYSEYRYTNSFYGSW
jgi:hypothetical protein